MEETHRQGRGSKAATRKLEKERRREETRRLGIREEVGSSAM